MASVPLARHLVVFSALCMGSPGCRSTGHSQVKLEGTVQASPYAYPFAVTLMSNPTPPRVMASGFFALSPYMILTNAHVIRDIMAAHQGLYIQSDNDPPLAIAADQWSVDMPEAYERLRQHPDAAAFPEVVWTMDYAVISLKEPLGTGRVATLSPTPAKVGERVAMAGFTPPSDDRSSRQRVVGTNVIAATTFKDLPLLSIDNSLWHRLINGVDSGDNAKPTEGDSGMPVMDAASGEVIGMTVSGGASDAQLLDLHEPRLLTFLAETAVKRGIAVPAAPKVPVIEPIVDDSPERSSDVVDGSVESAGGDSSDASPDQRGSSGNADHGR